jgi:hypothetical protein
MVAIAGLAAAGIALRVNNALRYAITHGFDAPANWRYIELLTESWALPPPDADWATAHPPFFYYLSAALVRALGHPEKDTSVIIIRLISTAVGLLAVGLAVALVRRADPENPRRALLAGALLLFLPVHIYTSAMLTEEVLTASLMSLAVVGVACELMDSSRPRATLARAAALGVAAGLALLTKLTGLMVVVAGTGAYAIEGWRRRDLHLGLGRAGVFLAAALLVGGWYYARNWVQYGYLYPHGLRTHEVMFTMPPGERHLGDYIRVPFATWTDPQVLSPDLLRSVWGSTYASIWFDGHRHFLPAKGIAVARTGTAILLLALLPTAAFLCGMGRGLLRWTESRSSPDAPLLLLVALTLAGYVLFTWRNPWFAVVKGSFLLGLSVPFAFYASEMLAAWTRGRDPRAAAIRVILGVLFLAVALTFTHGLVFARSGAPGMPWKPDMRHPPPWRKLTAPLQPAPSTGAVAMRVPRSATLHPTADPTATITCYSMYPRARSCSIRTSSAPEGAVVMRSTDAVS